MAGLCIREAILDLADEITCVSKDEVRKLVIRIHNPGLLELTAREILERGLRGEINGLSSMAIDDILTARAEYLRSHQTFVGVVRSRN